MLSSVTIANGATESSVINLDFAYRLSGINFPASFTGATVSFLAATEDAEGDPTYVAVVDGSGNATSVTATDSKWVVVPEGYIPHGVRYVKIVSASAETGAKSLQVALTPL